MKAFRLLLTAVFVLGVAGMVWSQSATRPSGVFGTIVKVDGKNIIVKTGRRDNAKEVTVATDEKTEFVVDAEKGKLDDLKADMRVRITPETGTATKVVATSNGLNGQVVKIDGKNVIIKTGRGDNAKEVTVATDENTKVFIGETASKLEDLKADMRVTVLPETGTAKKILVMPARATSRPASE
jgi:hypothetical protein